MKRQDIYGTKRQYNVDKKSSDYETILIDNRDIIRSNGITLK